MMAKKLTPSVITRETRRTGLKLYEQVTIDTTGDPATSQDALAALKDLLNSATPKARLEAVRKRAAKYSEVDGVLNELRFIEGAMEKPSLVLAIPFALTALERGLDLLDTGRYLTSIRRDTKTQEGRKLGNRVANANRAKLPDRAALIAEIENLMASKTRSEKDAKSIIRGKYKVSPSGLSQKLKQKKQ